MNFLDASTLQFVPPDFICNTKLEMPEASLLKLFHELQAQPEHIPQLLSAHYSC